VSWPEGFEYGKFCLKCEDMVRLKDTGETFEHGLMQKYECPECGSTFELRRIYKIQERDNTNKSTED